MSESVSFHDYISIKLDDIDIEIDFTDKDLLYSQNIALAAIASSLNVIATALTQGQKSGFNVDVRGSVNTN
jgi:hypothetical protein